MPPEEWLTTKEVAAILKITPQHAAYLLRKRVIGGRKVGRDWFTTREAVEEYRRNRPRPGPKPQREG